MPCSPASMATLGEERGSFMNRLPEESPLTPGVSVETKTRKKKPSPLKLGERKHRDGWV